VYDFIEECETYDEAITALQNLYVRVPNEIFARHLLATTKQEIQVVKNSQDHISSVFSLKIHRQNIKNALR